MLLAERDQLLRSSPASRSAAAHASLPAALLHSTLPGTQPDARSALAVSGTQNVECIVEIAPQLSHHLNVLLDPYATVSCTTAPLQVCEFAVVNAAIGVYDCLHPLLAQQAQWGSQEWSQPTRHAPMPV